MKKFLIKTIGFFFTGIFFFLILFLIARSIHIFPPSNMYYSEDVEQAFQEGDVELIALGNSKLLASLDKETLEEGMKMKTAIFGYNSSNISVSKLFLKAYLNQAREMPKIVLMEVSWFTFNKNRTNFHTISGDLLLRDFGMWKEMPRYYPDMLKYSLKRVLKQFHYFFVPPRPIDYSSRHKALPSDEKSYVFDISEMEKLFPNHTAGVDSFLLEDYTEILDICQDKGIELILYTAPEDEDYANAQKDINDVKKIYRSKESVIYLDYTVGGEFYDKKYENWLMDSHHINESQMFTLELVKDIKHLER